MIHTERVRHMTHLEAFRVNDGPDTFPIVKYFRTDYVWLHLLRAFVSATVCYGLLLLAWGLCNMELLMDTIHTMDLRAFATDVILRYIVFVAIYLIAVYFYAWISYTHAKKRMKTYNRHLKRLLAHMKQDGGTP